MRRLTSPYRLALAVATATALSALLWLGNRIIKVSLVHGEWILDSVLVAGEPAPSYEIEAGVTHYYYWQGQYLGFSDGAITGYDGCNHFWGSYDLDLLGHITLGSLEASLDSCPVQISADRQSDVPILVYHSERFMDALLNASRADVADNRLHLWSEGPPEVEMVFSNRYWHPQ